MIGAQSLRKRINISLMIGIPLLIAVLVFGSQIFSYYIVRINFLKLEYDEDVYIFDKVVGRDYYSLVISFRDLNIFT